MKRREFLKLGAGAALAGVYSQNEPLKALAALESSTGATFYVSSSGKDSYPGTEKLPFASLLRAQESIRQKRSSSATKVVVREGTYYLNSPLTFGPADSGSKEAPIIFSAYPEERVTISGGRKLSCNWKPYQNGIMMTEVAPGLEFTQLFVNGKRQIRARYPNYDPSDPGKSGYLQAAGSIPAGTVNPYAGPDDDMTYSAQAPRGVRFDPATFTKKKWANLEEAEIHIFQGSYWGNLQWTIKGID